MEFIDTKDSENENETEEFLPKDPRIAETYQEVFRSEKYVIVKQLVEVLEVVLGFETENKYQCFLPNGAELAVFEESTFLARWFCGNKRPFKLHVIFNQEEILMFQRNIYLCSSVLKVYDTKENVKIGKVKQKGGCCSKRIDIYVGGKKRYILRTPCCTFWVFNIFNMDGEHVGKIMKKWTGLFKEWMTDADNFGVKFPDDATIEEKACLYAATFLIDYLYFETDANSR